MPAQAAWHRAESRNFIVFAESSEAELRGTVAMLEDYAQLLRSLTQTRTPPSPNRLRIYLVRGPGELRQVRQLPREARGVYISGAEGIAAVADMRGALGTPMAVLFHEYAHHFMMQYHGRVYPPWYVEGFAEYMMTARFTDRAIEFGHADPFRVRMLSDRARWLPMDELLFGAERTSATIGHYYAQSWLLTHYLLSDPERLGQFRAYLAALAGGGTPREAFAASFAITPERLQRQLDSYAYRGLTFMRLPRSSAASPPEIRIERLPESADDLLLLQAAMHVGLRDDGEALERIRRGAARHSDRFAQRVLAQAEALYGNGDVADPLIDRLLEADPNDAELLYFRGMRYLAAAKGADGESRARLYRQARPWFARAHRIDPGHFQTLYRYVQTFSVEPGFVSENNVEVLLLAHTLAPQVPEIRLAAARMLVAFGDFAVAETLLLPLVGTAHEGPESAPARDLLRQARSRSREGVTVTFQ